MNTYESWWKPHDASSSEEGEAATADAPPSFDPRPMQPPQDAEGEKLPTRRIHILGLGSIGVLIAHALKQMPNPPPITLMMHKDEAYTTFKKAKRVLRLYDKASGVLDEQTDFDIDVKTRDEHSSATWWKYVAATKGLKTDPALYPLEENERLPSGEIYIHCLIVTVKAQHSVTALESVKHRLDRNSTICLMQNGLGQIDELNAKVFPDPATRPNYLVGVISHGCYLNGPFAVVHAGMGVTSLGIYRDTDHYPLPPASLANKPLSSLSPEDRRKHYPTDEELYTSSLSARFLLRTLTRSTILCSAAYPYLDLLMLQLEKLSANALLNPLTTLFDVPNGAMLGNRALNVVQNMLVSETSLVFRSLPELQGTPNIPHRFSPFRLKQLFVNVSTNTAQNSSSMREDLRRRRPATEIDYINGYIVRRGEELGIRCACHFMVTQMIKARIEIDQMGEKEYIPFNTTQLTGTVDTENLGQQEGVTLEDVGRAKSERGPTN